MMTKRQLCKAVLESFCLTGNIRVPFDQVNWDSFALQSSRVAVAASYLGLLSKEMDAYAAHRGGVLYITRDGEENAILTFRELLELLPE